MAYNYDGITVKVVVPTCKPKTDKVLNDQFVSMWASMYFWPTSEVFQTCGEGMSAAKNRNKALDTCKMGDIVIMVDDDVSHFGELWDLQMVQPLIECDDVMLVSARLLNSNDTVQKVMGADGTKTEGIVTVPYCPSSCIAFRHEGIFFDEAYKGSGFEDTDFCNQLKMVHPKKRFVINNWVKVRHGNECKNQNEHWEHNRRYYNQKWKKHE